MPEQTASLKDILQRLIRLEDDSKPNLDAGMFAPLAGKEEFWRVNMIAYDGKPDSSRMFASALSPLAGMGCRLMWLVSNSGGVAFHIGIKQMRQQAGWNAARTLADAFIGTFRGSHLQYVDNQEEVRKRIACLNVFSVGLGIPTLSLEPDSRQIDPAMDRLIHAMGTRNFCVALVWESAKSDEAGAHRKALANIYRDIMPWLKGGRGRSKSFGKSGNNASDQESSSESENYEICDKTLQLWQKALDDELLPRAALGCAKGLFSAAAYLGADNARDLAYLENLYINLFQDSRPSCAPLYTLRLPSGPQTASMIAGFGICGKLPAKSTYLPLLARPLNQGITSLSTLLTGREIGILARFPHEDVPGLEASPRVSFGLNLPYVKRDEAVELGDLLKDGAPLEGHPARLKRSDMERHIFVAGVTGSGKTTTCLRILSECAASNGFLVIEPAKTEYRDLLADKAMGNVVVFTVGNEKISPFRLNPFEFLPSETISAHIDLLKASFMASFDMEAAIPQLLEQAMYKVYEIFGWNIADDSNRFLKDREDAWRDRHRHLFPTISDFIRVVVDLAKSMGFGQRLQDEYTGSLKARLESLTVGSKGMMLNCRRSIDFEWLLNKRVVIELEELKSGEDKAFVMALLIGRLVEALKARYKRDEENGAEFQHILLLEEAHRLLPCPDASTSPARRLSIDMFTDLLAEVRKYHECLIIVDQVPSRLAPEVLKNTSTKIAHTLFARDDKIALGDAMALTKEQTDRISKLRVGQAIVASRDWPKAAHVAIKGDLCLPRATEKLAHESGRRFWENNAATFCPDMSQKAKYPPTMKTLRRMSALIQELPKHLPRDVVDAERARWQEFLRVAQRDIGEDAEVFLQSAIASLLLRKALRNSAAKDYHAMRKDCYAKAIQIMEWHPSKLRGFLSNYNWEE